MRISAGLQLDTVYSSTVIFQCHFQLKPQGWGCWANLAAPGIINMRWGGAADKYEGGGGAAWLSAGRHINHHVSPSSSSSRWRHFSCIAFQPTLHYIVASCGRVHFWRSSEPARSGQLIQGLAKKGGLKTCNHSNTPQSLSWHGLFPSQQTHGHMDQMVDFFRISSIYAQNQMITKGEDTAMTYLF